jgi:hypothetical protein
MATIKDIKKRARLREKTVTVCLAGDLQAEFERLEAQLAKATKDAWQASSLASATPGQEIAQQLADLQVQMTDAEVTFRLRALGRRAWSDLVVAHPSEKPDLAYDPETFSVALVSACSIDPKMTVEEVDDLFETLNNGQVQELIDGAFEVNSGATQVPFSLAASAILASRTDAK